MRLRLAHLLGILLFTVVFPLVSNLPVYGQDDSLKLIINKQKALKEREDNLRKEEERLKAFNKELDEKIERYSKLLTRIEEALNDLKKESDKRFQHVVKTYEAMPPEEAAQRISELDEKTATKILSVMKSKKASAILAAMEPKKVAILTTGILKVEKKFPIR